jgi:probable HAF family extracellular repeat protein
MTNPIAFRGRGAAGMFFGRIKRFRFVGQLALHGTLAGALGMVFWLHPTALQAQTQAPGQTPAAYIAVEYARVDNPGATQVIRNMNSSDEVAGGYQINRRNASSALILSGNSVIEDISGDQGAGNSVAFGINDQGEIAGAYNTDTAQRPFRSVRKTGFQELTLPAGSNGGVAYSINELGEAAGYVSGANGVRPAWWTRRGDVQVLAGGAGASTKALDINAKGDIVGVSGNDTLAAVLWPRKGGIVSLAALPGFTNSEAVAISDNASVAGVVTGTAGFPNRARAVLWNADTRAVQDLGTLPGGTDSRARDVNNRGEVVGRASTPNGTRAFVWTAATGMRDLNTLVSVPGLVMTDAVSVNRRGAIVVVGQDANTTGAGDDHQHEDHHAARRIYVLRPVP